MEVIVHYPSNQKDLKALKDKVALLHAEAIIKYVDNISCPKEQKIQLIKKVEQSFKCKI